MSVSGLGRLAATRRGVIAAYDEARGLGSVREADGTERPFHCTAIVDGTRAIDVGSAVFYALRPACTGQIEATHIATAAMLALAARFRDEPAVHS